MRTIYTSRLRRILYTSPTCLSRVEEQIFTHLRGFMSIKKRYSIPNRSSKIRCLLFQIPIDFSSFCLRCLCRHFPFDPRHQKTNDLPLLKLRQLPSRRYAIPLAQAAATAARASVLGHKHGMSAHRRLFPVIGWIRRGESRADEVLAMAADCRHPLLGDISPIGLGKVEAASEP